jgi:hypothetical protein
VTVFTLKIIALVTMLIDHAGAVFPEVFGFPPAGANIFRVIGRVSFPIFVYLLAEGFRHTKNRQKFLVRLGLFALISEVPYDLAFGNDLNFIARTNIFYTLFLGGATITAHEYLRENKSFIASVVALFPFMFLAEALTVDYGAVGVVFIFAVYAAKSPRIRLATMAGFCVLLHFAMLRHFLQGYSVPTMHLAMIPATLFAVLICAFYNGKRGAKLKWIFYALYPTHLLLFAILQ